MRPTPRRLPLLTAGLLGIGMGFFIARRALPPAADAAVAVMAGVIFSTGLLAALLGMIWSICTLTSPILRQTRGITTPVVTILIALLAWVGAGLTVHKFKQASDARPEPAAAGAGLGVGRGRR
jgi:predicted tellurium resistance membrane protein TerC